MARCSLETLEVRAVFDDGALSDLRPDARNRAKELIEDFMIAANGVTARYLEQKAHAVAAPGARCPQALGPDRRAGGRVRETRLPLKPDAAALDAFLDRSA